MGRNVGCATVKESFPVRFGSELSELADFFADLIVGGCATSGHLTRGPGISAADGRNQTRAEERAFSLVTLGPLADQGVILLCCLSTDLPKYATQQQDVRSAAYAGSTDWHKTSRSVWTLDDQNGNLVLRCDKTNYGSVPDPVTLESTDGCVWQAKSGTVRRRAVKKNPHG